MSASTVSRQRLERHMVERHTLPLGLAQNERHQLHRKMHDATRPYGWQGHDHLGVTRLRLVPPAVTTVRTVISPTAKSNERLRQHLRERHDLGRLATNEQRRQHHKAHERGDLGARP